MTKDEYNVLKAKIEQEYGKAEYDNHAPANEAAKRVLKLLAEYRLSCRAAKRAEAKEKGQLQETKLEDLATPEIKDKYKGVAVPEFEIDEKLLIVFTPKETEIIRMHFEDMSLSNKQLAFKCNVSRQVVTGLFVTQAFKILEEKLFNQLMPTETRIALLKATRGGDSRIVQRLAEHYKILNPEKMEIDVNKPIDDPAAIKLLKEMGDRLADEK